jgi:hypothetical protein
MRIERFALLLWGIFAGGFIAVSMLTPAGVLVGATVAEAQSFQSVVEAFYNDEFRTHPIAATQIGVHDYDAEVDDLSRDGYAINAFINISTFLLPRQIGNDSHWA